MRSTVWSLIALATCLAASTAQAAPQIVHAGTLLVEPGIAPLNQATLIIDEDKVREARPGFLSPEQLGLPAETPVVDLSRQFVMPGFIDLHVHLSSFGDRNELLRRPDEYASLIGARNANTTLMAGFTTVRDLGSIGYSIIALRDAIGNGLVPGPRIVASGDPISPTNGHADNHGMREEVMHALPRRGVCDGADGCRRAVREAVRRGADVIKVMASGGTLDESDAPTDLQFSPEELRAIAETAHALGRKVTAHAHGKQSIIACIEAGFDSIEHGMWADEPILRMMKATGVWLIPTVWPIDYVGTTPEQVRVGPMGKLPPVSLNKVIALGDQPKRLARMAQRLGVKIALGTDAGVYPHGQNAHEFAEYVEAGMTPMQAIVAGTIDAALAGGIKGVGSLKPGMYADLVALPTSPLDDIDAVLDVPFVMKGGVIYKADGIERYPMASPAPIPAWAIKPSPKTAKE
ncbi:amidohydrolase family protein [Novosphingobium sp. BL-52-GroH]|uniref:metal-dependent hydrolase family protein n=1 Tax=Novosphingobium sp. BL-52-GroH TaxID=3349877 RepID=UPI0038502927